MAAVSVLLSSLFCFAASFARAEHATLDVQKLRALAQAANDVGVSTYFMHEGDCALLFVGTEHSFDPHAELFRVLDADWEAFAPRHLIVEGGDWPILADRDAQIRAYGAMPPARMRWHRMPHSSCPLSPTAPTFRRR